MAYDKVLTAASLQRWSRYAEGRALPAWEQIPDFGLYMDQVTLVLQQYLDFMPPPTEGKDSFVTASAINNYVRLKIMPPPVKKKYGRVHIAYLMMILTLKLTLSIAQIGALLPGELTQEQVHALYDDFCARFERTRQHDADRLQQAAQELDTAADTDSAVSCMVMEHALAGAFHTLLAGRLLALNGGETESGDA